MDEWHIAQLSNLLGFDIERDNDGRAKDADVEFALQTLIENLQLGSIIVLKGSADVSFPHVFYTKAEAVPFVTEAPVADMTVVLA